MFSLFNPDKYSYLVPGEAGLEFRLLVSLEFVPESGGVTSPAPTPAPRPRLSPTHGAWHTPSERSSSGSGPPAHLSLLLLLGPKCHLSLREQTGVGHSDGEL